MRTEVRAPQAGRVVRQLHPRSLELRAKIPVVQPDERLLAAVQQARRYGADLPAPTNEANTCHWVIHPLLLALGYENHEVMAQAFDVSGKFPDYTILPDTDHAWYVEAKAWTVPLEDAHVNQALNYAHQNGRRWVVLTNGRQWRLYDDTIRGLSSARLVAQTNLSDDEFVPFVSALSRASVQANGVANYAASRIVHRVLRAELANPEGAIVKAVARELRKLVPSARVTGPDVCRLLADRSGPTHTSPIPPPSPTSVPCAPATSAEPNVEQPDPITVTFRIKDIVGKARFENPVTVLLPGCQLTRDLRPSCRDFLAPKLAKLQDAGLIEDRGTHYTVTAEIPTNSPSGAGVFVAGGAVNGWECWKDEQGNAISIYRKAK